MKYTAALVVALALLAAPLAAEAQPPAKIWRVGLFHVGLDHVPPSLEPLRQELKALGYKEGRTIHMDWRNLPDEAVAREVAKEFVQNRVDLIVAFENQTVRAAKAATSEIPIVFLHVTDPVAAGFVASMARPGGNVTGFVGVGDVPAKWMELFKELIPKLRRVLTLIDPEDPVTPHQLAEIRRAAEILNLKLVEREARTASDVRRLFASIKRDEVDGVVLASVNLRANFSPLIIRLASERRLPLPSHRKEFAEQGALFSYGPDFASVGPLAARYIDRIFKGVKPADLPVDELSRYNLVINSKVAKALGLTIPPSVLARADEVIE